MQPRGGKDFEANHLHPLQPLPRDLQRATIGSCLPGMLIAGGLGLMGDPGAEVLNLRGVVCPYNFVRTKLKLEEIERGRELLIILDDPSAAANVSRSLENEGHRLKSVRRASEELWEILVEKA